MQNKVFLLNIFTSDDLDYLNKIRETQGLSKYIKARRIVLDYNIRYL